MLNNIKNQWEKEKGVFLLVASFFLLFLLITYWSPVAGDDWAYAVNSVDHHPLALALERYFTWSGRILSELWGYIIPRNKWLWDWVNPLLFTGILYCLLKNTRNKTHLLLTGLFAVVMILTVTDYVRSQTYTWMMGTTYVVPLLLFLLYAYLLYQFVFENQNSQRNQIGLIVLNFTIPLWMENAAAIVVGGDLLVLIFLYFHDRGKLKQMIWFFLAGILGTAIIKFSPGANSRLAMDHAEFMNMNLLDKVHSNLTMFIRLTFTDNLWLTRGISFTMLVYVIAKRSEYPCAKWHCWILALIFSWGILQTYSWNLYELTGISAFAYLNDPSWILFNKVNLFGYGLWIVAFLYVTFTYLKGNQKWFTAWVFFCAGGANLVMLISPIFDARSSIYTIFLLILAGMQFVSEISFSKSISVVVSTVFAVVYVCCMVRYAKMYHYISQIMEARNAYVSWYLGDRSVKDGVMPEYPELYVHSGNITPEDEFHLYYFLRYYDLDPNLKLRFEYVDLDTVGK